ncbi:MAG: PspC domain-containing protein [Microlunatus sp.]|nr:PspC domain-containing protein [Microlunatus sp.]
MTNPYPPSEPRRLTRDPSNKLIGGVCSGIAKYLNMDVNLVRILTVLISLFTGIPIVLYIVALFVMPEERQPPPPPHLGGPDPMHYQAPGYDAAAQPYPPYRQPDAQRPPDDVW